MDVVVCIKQVPDTTDVKLNPQDNTLVREGVRSVINPFDLFALEEALRLKERYGGRVLAICMGPPQAKHALEDAIAMGADEALLLSSQSFAGSDTLATSYTLACAIKRISGFDLIICGKQATDGDTAQVGPGIAVHLGIPQATYVRRIRERTREAIVVERMMDRGYDVVRLPCPCLITVVKEINVPRFPSFLGKVRAKQASIPIWGPNQIDGDASRIGLTGSPTWVDHVSHPALHAGKRPFPATPGRIKELAEEISETLGEAWASRS